MERKGISKSAPAARRRNSSTKNDKSSTIKEINKWINKGNSDHFSRTCSRGVSTLTENVTEERMLYSRQLELGRERYKFLANHEYEKQKFVERQQIKEKMMNQFMASARKVIEKAYAEKPKRILTIRIPQMEDSSARSSPVAEDQAVSRAESRLSRVSSKVGQKRDVATEAPQTESKTSRNSSHKTPQDKNGNRNIKSSSKRQEVYDSEFLKYKTVDIEAEKTSGTSRAVYFDTSNLASNGHQPEGIKTGSRLPSVLVNQRSARNRKSAVRERSRSTSPSKSVRYAVTNEGLKKSLIHSEPSTPKWTKSPHGLGKFGEKFDTSVNDPRYVALTNTLMRVGDMKRPQRGVKEIIEKNEVFKYVSKSEDAAHAKQMHAKFIALLLENEFK